MNPKNLDVAIAYMRDHWHLITDDESAYKTVFVIRAAPMVAAAVRDANEWSRVLAKYRKEVGHALGWRTAGMMHDLVLQHPGCLQDAVPMLYETVDADMFWDKVARGVGGDANLTPYGQLRGVGARASVASLFLFLHDPHTWPLFRSRNFGETLVRLTGEPLDRTTPGSLLTSYYAEIGRLRTVLREAGLPVRTNLDTQGILWVLNYKHVLDQEPES